MEFFLNKEKDQVMNERKIVPKAIVPEPPVYPYGFLFMG